MDWIRLELVFCKSTIHLICVAKYRCTVLDGLVEVRFEEVVMMFAANHGYQLLAVRVYDG